MDKDIFGHFQKNYQLRFVEVVENISTNSISTNDYPLYRVKVLQVIQTKFSTDKVGAIFDADILTSIRFKYLPGQDKIDGLSNQT